MPEKEKPFKCFISLDLPDNAVAALKEIQDELRRQRLFTGIFSEKESLHVVLKFIGNINPDKAKMVAQKLREIKSRRITCSLGALGVSSESFVRAVWISLDDSGIYELQKELDNLLLPFFLKEENFEAHVKLASVNTIKQKENLFDYIKKAKYEKIKFEVNSFSLQRFENTPSGKKYVVVENYNLD